MWPGRGLATFCNRGDTMSGFDDPRLKPIWLRAVIVLSCLGWALFELFTGAPGWAIIFGAAGAFLFWRLLVAYSAGNRQ